MAKRYWHILKQGKSVPFYHDLVSRYLTSKGNSV